MFITIDLVHKDAPAFCPQRPRPGGSSAVGGIVPSGSVEHQDLLPWARGCSFLHASQPV